jgi:hypothetical protein
MMEVMTDKYEVIFDPQQDTALIRITEGKFQDFVFKYGNVSVGDDEAETFPVQFNYELKSAPDTYEYIDEQADKLEFEQTLGDILYDIIVNTNKVKEKSGISNTEQSD